MADEKSKKKEQEKKQKILVTSALPYVNNVPHLGTMVCILSADVYARFLKLKQADSIFVCGTDEHGTATETKALEEGLTPKQLTDKYFKKQKEIYEWFNCAFDCFGRTSSKENHDVATDIFLKLKNNNFLIEEEIEQLYCQKDNKFLADRYVEGICPICGYENAKGDQCERCGNLLNATELKEPRCKLCKNVPIIKKTKHFFINLPKLQPEIEKWVKKISKSWSQNALTMTNSWLKQGLKPRCITRDLSWGINVPVKGYENKVLYCWFDAPIGYISITKSCRDDWKKWWHNPENVKLVQFMGKDNIPFHTIMFPGFLIGAKDNYTLLDQISSNEYMNYENAQFSKSRGTGVFGDDAMKTGIKADAWRYYIIVNRPEKQDTEFTWKDFAEKLNNELVANLGNFINRTTTFIDKFFKGVIPGITPEKKDEMFLDSLKKQYAEIESLLEKLELKEALKKAMHVSRLGNIYFQENEPWKLIKEDEKKAGTVLGIMANTAKDISIIIEPFMPGIAKEIRDQLNIKETKEKKLLWENLGELLLKQGHKISKPNILFKKLDEKELNSFQERFGGQQNKQQTKQQNKMQNKIHKKNKAASEPEFSFSHADLRTAKILEASQHPDADKLYVLSIDAGEKKPRQLVAGLKGYYTTEELAGKNIVIAANLKPAKLRGIESNGMLLAVDHKEKVCVVTHDSSAGEQLFIEGVAQNPKKEITIDEFFSLKLKAKNRKIFFEDKELRLKKGKIFSESLESGDVR